MLIRWEITEAVDKGHQWPITAIVHPSHHSGNRYFVILFKKNNFSLIIVYHNTVFHFFRIWSSEWSVCLDIKNQVSHFIPEVKYCYVRCLLSSWMALMIEQIQVLQTQLCTDTWYHDDVIKWKHFPRYWPFLRGIHRSPVNSPHRGQWRRALMFSLICAWINGWVNNGEAGDLRRHRAHYAVTVMWYGSDELLDLKQIYQRYLRGSAFWLSDYMGYIWGISGALSYRLR